MKDINKTLQETIALFSNTINNNNATIQELKEELNFYKKLHEGCTCPVNARYYVEDENYCNW